MYVTLHLLDALHLGRQLSGVHLRPHGRVIYDPTVGSSTTSRSGHLRPHGRVIYDPMVGSSTTPRSGHLRPHGRVIYDLTVGSSTTPRSGHLRPHGRVIYDPHGRVVAVLFSRNSPRYYPLHEQSNYPFLVIRYEILTGSIKYLDTDGYLCELCKYCYRDSRLRTTKLPPGGWMFLRVCNKVCECVIYYDTL